MVKIGSISKDAFFDHLTLGSNTLCSKLPMVQCMTILLYRFYYPSDLPLQTSHTISWKQSKMVKFGCFRKMHFLTIISPYDQKLLAVSCKWSSTWLFSTYHLYYDFELSIWKQHTKFWNQSNMVNFGCFRKMHFLTIWP
jgi:hypothetical protein